MELAEKQCIPCRGGIPPLKGDTLQALFDQLDTDGNGVVIEEQVIKANQTQMDFTLMTRVYEKNISMMRYALRGTGAG